MRKPFIAANWKMNKTMGETGEFINSFIPLVSEAEGVDILIAPPFTCLNEASGLLQKTGIRLAAQNVFYEEKGAFTGEISAQMLLSAG
ncbi:MAG TPA: triose-phosphate isomerase, partial [Nitrospirae bacterium]|nr:triose-phosphate isomerase [Nitrospirota bacterium]